MWGISFTLQRIGGGAEAADGCTKWIFLVCNEAASSASLWEKNGEACWISGNKVEEVVKSDMQMLEGGQQPVIAGETGEVESLGSEMGKMCVVGRNHQGSEEVFHNMGCHGVHHRALLRGTSAEVLRSKTKPQPAAETRD